MSTPRTKDPVPEKKRKTPVEQLIKLPAVVTLSWMLENLEDPFGEIGEDCFQDLASWSSQHQDKGQTKHNANIKTNPEPILFQSLSLDENISQCTSIVICIPKERCDLQLATLIKNAIVGKRQGGLFDGVTFQWAKNRPAGWDNIIEDDFQKIMMALADFCRDQDEWVLKVPVFATYFD